MIGDEVGTGKDKTGAAALDGRFLIKVTEVRRKKEKGTLDESA